MTRPPFTRGETVVLNRHKATGEFDDYGNVIYAQTAVTVAGVAIWPYLATRGSAGDEVVQSVDRTTTVYLCMFPSTVDIQAIDTITWRGKTYEVQGQPQHLHSPLTGSANQQLHMTRVEG